MKRFFRLLLRGDGGQDLVEYTLLLAFVSLAGAGMFLGSGGSIGQIWSSANSVLTAGSQSPPSGSGGGNPGGGDPSSGGHGGGDHGGDGGGDGR